MKSSFKYLAVSAAAFLIYFPVFSFETGGLLSNDTKFENIEKNGSLKLDQKNGVNLWLRSPVSEDGESYLAAEGSFQYELDDRYEVESSSDKMNLYGDLNLFKLVLKRELEAGDLTFSCGRFYNSDLSGLVFTQNADGAKLEANLPHVSLALYGAYTGLLNAKNITIIGDTTDLSEKNKTPYVLADKFAVCSAAFSFPYLFLSQTLSLEGLGTFSLESEKVNRFYGTLSLNGPLVSPAFYSLSSTMGFTKYDGQDMEKGNLTKASISVYPEYKSMSLSLNGVYASGCQGSLKPFTAFTKGTAVNSQDEPAYSGNALAGLSASIKPLENLLLYGSGDMVFSTAAGEELDKIEQAGFQFSLGCSWQVVSDVSLGGSYTQFIGKDDYEEGSKQQLKITAGIAF